MDNDISNAIAIIGMACRFPKSNNLEQYWENIRDGKECLETLSQEDLKQAGIDYTILENREYIKRCPCIEDIDKFDADFFKISPKEATYMDPQQRLMLEKVWEAIEDAGYSIDKIDGKIAMFASTSASSYFLQNILNNPNFVEEAGGIKAVLHGLDKDHMSTKIAYKLNFTGPAITVQSACSSSMVGTIMACQNLLTYQCDVALAGGVTINVPQRVGYMYEKGNVMSQDGYCRPFDENASGTIFGSGVGCIVLKRLEDAIKDNDRIYSIIRGFAIGNDGNDKVGYTAPGIRGQMDVIGDALEFAQINPGSISYMEAHGTGTIMGDPIEVEAISKVYKQYTNKKQYCALGSVKANVGHLNAASGIAGLIKTALLIKNKVIPPLINISQENSKINFKNSPFYINKESKIYDGNGPMRASVSSFGIGGTNGHVIMEEYCKGRKKGIMKSCYLFPLSARDNEDLRTMCKNLSDYISSHSKVSLGDVERTLQCGRKEFNVRKAFLAGNSQELIQNIDRFLKESRPYKKMEEKHLKVVISSSGDSLETKELYKDISLFQNSYDECKRIMKEICTDDVWKQQNKVDILISQTAIVKTWVELGIEVKAMLHIENDDGIGFTFKDTLHIKESISKFLGIPLNEKEENIDFKWNTLFTNTYREFLNVIVNWWQMGKRVCWEKWIHIKEQNIISLPTYPFKRTSFWSYSERLRERENQQVIKNIQLVENIHHERPELSTSYMAPESKLQKRLIDMWCEILGINGIGIEDDFFELGGHSLMGTQLIAAIKDEFLVDLEVDELFECSTVSKLTDMIVSKLWDLVDLMDEREVNSYLEMENEYEL